VTGQTVIVARSIRSNPVTQRTSKRAGVGAVAAALITGFQAICAACSKQFFISYLVRVRLAAEIRTSLFTTRGA
jgi:hypothetical protein